MDVQGRGKPNESIPLISIVDETYLNVSFMTQIAVYCVFWMVGMCKSCLPKEGYIVIAVQLNSKF